MSFYFFFFIFRPQHKIQVSKLFQALVGMRISYFIWQYTRGSQKVPGIMV